MARLEAAASGQSRQNPFDGHEAQALHGRHQALRGTVEGAIAKIDSMIQSTERR